MNLITIITKLTFICLKDNLRGDDTLLIRDLELIRDWQRPPPVYLHLTVKRCSVKDPTRLSGAREKKEIQEINTEFEKKWT